MIVQNASKLLTVRQDLADLVRTVAGWFPLVVLCGHRNKADQDRAFRTKHSKVRWPDSKHNYSPSRAVDIAPVPLDWDDRERFVLLAGAMLATARTRGLDLRWGGDWNGNLVIADEVLQDLAHFEIKGE